MTEHTDWCKAHLTEFDGGHTVEVCRASVTVRGVTVNLETSPSWGPEHRPVVPPDVEDLTVEGARALSDALVIAASVLDGNRHGALLVDQG